MSSIVQDVLSVAPKASAKNTNSSKSVADKADNSTQDEQSFLASLVQAIDETNEFLPENMKITPKEVVSEAMASIQKGEFDEVEKTSIFENLSFMEVLGVLEKLKIDTSDVKLANLSSKAQDFVKTEQNLQALKGAKSLNELLDLAKNLNLNVKNIRVDRLLEVKSSFPNLDKANFFTNSVQSVFKDVLNQKISKIMEDLSQKQELPSSKKTNISQENVLKKTLQSLDLHTKKDTKTHAKTQDKKETPKLEQQSIIVDNHKEDKKDLKTNLQDDMHELSKAGTKQAKEELKFDEKSKTHFVAEEELKPSKEIKPDTKISSLKEEGNKLELTPEKKDPKNEPKKLDVQEEKLKVLDEEKQKTTDIKSTQILEKELVKEQKSENKHIASDIKSASILSEKSEKKEMSSLKQTQEPLMQNVKNNTSEQVLTAQKVNTPSANENLQRSVNTQAQQIKQNTEDKKTQNKSNVKEEKLNLNENIALNTDKSSQQVNDKSVNNIKTQVNTEPKNFNETKSLLDDVLTKLSTSKNGASNTQNVQKSTHNDQFDVQNESFKSVFSKDESMNELNHLVKDLNRVSQNEIKANVNVKETFQSFASDLKEQMQNYKAPITRLNITLNPSNLGEVEVTLVQRGNNLHINFNSNTNAMNLFLQNQAEFKNSLVNMGFTGLEMNFSDQSKKDQNQGKNRSGHGFKEEINALNSEEKPNLELVLAKYF
ncbi:flagellar hook-length control protein FliK [Campylobacter sp. MIT 99-7217]|nr:flagellar hook-length control protein FliK [Campylobacter sp. MIT 99-7217]TQR31312.1 flagellar hook-length control protein FliK [Campylobacter sp. MIT 99-7217]